LQPKLAVDTGCSASRENTARQTRSSGPSVQVQGEEDKKMLIKEHIMGVVKPYMYVVEFEQRGSFHVKVVGLYLSSFFDDRL
jgi:hypothetical protein